MEITWMSDDVFWRNFTIFSFLEGFFLRGFAELLDPLNILDPETIFLSILKYSTNFIDYN